MKNIKNQLILLLLIVATANYSCKKFLEIGPPTNSATPEEMFANDAIATSAITGVYSRMSNSGIFSGDANSVSLLCGLSADELKSYGATLDVYYKNEIPATTTALNSQLWLKAYSYILTSNSIIEGVKSASGLSQNTSKQLEGEAKFVRAFCYFYLVNLFGEVPLNLTPDYRLNENNGRSSKLVIYDQIVHDLTDAEVLLLSDYVTTERVRPNKWAAKALLSRVYLYMEKWDLATQKSTEVLNQTSMYSLVSLNDVFLKNSAESIWQLMPAQGLNTPEGRAFVLTSTPTTVSLSPSILTAFETGDVRRTNWINKFTNATGDYYYPYKYKIKSTVNGEIKEYSMVIRLAEVVLIRAEARARLGQMDLALADINKIRLRAGLTTPLVGLDQT